MTKALMAFITKASAGLAGGTIAAIIFTLIIVIFVAYLSLKDHKIEPSVVKMAISSIKQLGLAGIALQLIIYLTGLI